MNKNENKQRNVHSLQRKVEERFDDMKSYDE